jgi:hypothetical protein
MRRSGIRLRGITVLAGTGALALAVPSGASAYHATGGSEWRFATAIVRPAPGHGALGLVHLSAHPRGPTQVRALFTGIRPIPRRVLALSALSCGDAGDVRRFDRGYLPPGLIAARDGSGRMDRRNAFSSRQLSRARSVVVVVPRAGRPDVLVACGRLTARQAGDGDGRLVEMSYLGSGYAGGRLLAHALGRPGGDTRGAAIVTGLHAHREYTLALSSRSCREVEQEPDEDPLAVLGRLRTGSLGYAFGTSYTAPFDLTTLGRAGSAVATRGLLVGTCASSPVFHPWNGAVGR